MIASSYNLIMVLRLIAVLHMCVIDPCPIQKIKPPTPIQDDWVS
jgi:hypothetical protein